jgi:hypothetical protein
MIVSKVGVAHLGAFALSAVNATSVVARVALATLCEEEDDSSHY